MATSMPKLVGRFERGFLRILTQPRRWFVLVGDRLVVAGTLVLGFALAVVALSSTDLVVPSESTQILYLFQGLVTANVTLVTIVVSINQLVISRELNAPGELQDRIQNVIDYRDRVEETTQSTSVPVTPSDFLVVLLDGTRETSQQLGGIAETLDSTQHRDDVKSLVAELTQRLDRIRQQNEQSQGGIFSALASMLETNFSHQLHEAYRLKTEYDDELPESAHDLLEELIDGLRQLDIARQYFRSIYIQTELARLSRILLYVGLPAVGVTLLFLYMTASNGESPVSMAHLEVIVPAVLILGFVPLAVLFSFILRIAAVVQRTVAITPFTTPEQEFGFRD